MPEVLSPPMCGSKTDQELDIDAEFTRPGVEAFLNEFSKTLKSEAVSMCKAKFKWK